MLRPLAWMLVLAVGACAQSMVEYSLGTARAASSGAAMNKAGKSAAAAMEKAAKSLDDGASAAGGTLASQSTTSKTLEAAKTAPEAPKFKTPEAREITAGMQTAELVKKFGDPAMKVSGSEENHVIETWWYGRDPKSIMVKVRDGKVATVIPPDEKSESVITVAR